MLLKRFFAFSLCLFVGVFLQAQQPLWRSGEFLLGVNLGVNYSNLDIRDSRLKSGARPFSGLDATYVLNHRLGLKGAGFFSMKSSIFSSTVSLEQTGIDLQFYPQYKIDDLFLNAGLAVDFPINKNLQYKGSGGSEGTRIDQEIAEERLRQLNLLLGFELKLMPSWRISANFMLPAFNSQSRNFQLGLSYRISQPRNTKVSPRKIRKRITARQIKSLKDGALLVRLKTSKPTIEALKRRGLFYEAREKERQQRIENISLVKAFQSRYNFSEVRFFTSDQSWKVRQGNFEGIFVNDSIQVDSNIVLRNKKHVYTAEFDLIEPDTATFFSHYRWVPTGNFAAVQVPVFYGGGGNSFMSLVIKDQQFRQLYRPFPYYSRALFKAMEDHPDHGIFYFPLKLFSPMNYLDCVGNLDRKLWRFHEKVKRKNWGRKP
jgi:hypothetical protein